MQLETQSGGNPADTAVRWADAGELDTSQSALGSLARLAARVTRSSVVLISRLDGDREYLLVSVGLNANQSIRLSSPLYHSPAARALRAGAPLVVPSVAASPLADDRTIAELGLASYLAFPLADHSGRLIGVLGVGDVQERAWSSEEIALLEDLVPSATEVLLAAIAPPENGRNGHDQEIAQLKRLSQDRIHNLTAHAQDIVYRYELSPWRGHSYMSPAVTRVVGYTPEEFYADPDLTSKITLPEDRETVASAQQGGQVVPEALVRMQHKAGQTVWLDLHRVPIYDQSGEVIAFEGIAREVTQFMRTAEALRFSEQRYRELFDAAQRQAQELALLDQVRTALTRELNISAIFKTVVEAVSETFGYTQVSIYAIEGDTLVLQYQVGYDQVITRIPLGLGVAGRVASSGKAELVEDVQQEQAFIGAVEGITSEICVPLSDESTLVGILNVESSSGPGLTEQDLRLMLGISEQVSIAISRARLYSQALENEEKYRSVIENVTEVIYQTDSLGIWTFLNPAWSRITGFEIHVSIGTGLIHYIHLDDRELHEREFEALISGQREYSRYEVRCQTLGMGTRWLEVHARPIADSSGQIIGTSGTLNDVTDSKLAEDALLRQNEELAALHETMLGVVNQLDVNSLLEAIMSRAAMLMGTPHGFIYLLEPGETDMVLRLGSGVYESVVGAALERGSGLSGHVWDTGEPAAIDDYRVWPGRKHDLEHLGVRAVSGIPLRSGSDIVGVLGLAFVEDDKVFGLEDVALLSRFGQLASLALDNARLYAAAQQELIERKRAEERLAYLALHDPLTGLPNRTLLNDRLQQAIRTAVREMTPLALLVMDMDRFKDVNDTLGHHIGDELLQQIGSRLQTGLRASDTVARLGGDEFAVLLPGADLNGATLAARKLLALMEVPFALEGHPLDVRMSIGIALSPDHGQEQEVLMRRADVAMYIAKRGGTGYALYSPDQDPYSPGRLALAGELRKAIELDELTLYYQPKVGNQTGRMTGVEALVRWNHPQRGLLSPGEFLPLAEHTGLIGLLSQWVLSAALAQCRVWSEMGLIIPVAVNLSMRDLRDSRLPITVQKLVETWEVDPSLLMVEITEDAVMADLTGTLDVLTRLRDLGVRLAIDDFGTGQSSLAQLKRLPVDQIKIDRSFVRELAQNENDTVIVRSTIDLGHNLGLSVVAEGVEDQASLSLLTELGCDEAQGYFLSRPVPSSEIPRWLAAREAQLNGH